MNQTFSLSRFGRLLRTYFTENRTALLINVALLTVILVVPSWLVYHQYPLIASRNRYLVLFFVGAAAWYIFTIQQVSVLNEKERAITYLLRPASKLEKWVQLVLISGIAFVIVYLLLFMLVDTVGVWYINHRAWAPRQLNELREYYSNRLTIEPFYNRKDLVELPAVFWVGTLLLHPLTLAFGLLIRRYGLPLIPVVVFCLLGLLFLVNMQFLQSFVDDQISVSAVILGDMFVARAAKGKQVLVPQPIGDVIRYGVGALVILLLYVTAYFRLKEREV